MKNIKYKIVIKNLVLIFYFSFLIFHFPCFAQDIKEPSAAGTFYPEDAHQLSVMIEGFLDAAKPQAPKGKIFALIEPHAGYGFSGPTAAYGYKLIQGNSSYRTVVIIGTSHTVLLNGVSVYPKGVFRTPLGDVEIDNEFASQLLGKDPDVVFEPSCFLKEHSVEVQLPFLQKALVSFKIVPVIVGDCSLLTCKNFAGLLKQAIGQRQDVLVVVSTDMAHRYDYQEVEAMDALTISYLKDMEVDGLYYNLRDSKIELCGGFGAVSVLMLAKELGYDKLEVLKYTNSAEVTGKKDKGTWTVGYVSCVIPTLQNLPAQSGEDEVGRDSARGGSIDQPEGEKMILNSARKKKLLEIARKSIDSYLKSGKKMEITENDPVLSEVMGAFVTLHEHGQLRGCIGNIIGRQPLYLTVRDMAVEAAVGDPRFSPLESSELKNIEIEISVLSPLEKIDSIDKIELGKHGVLIRKGSRSGVFLPQVAEETGWSKQEFLENLCVHKAGLSADAWKDKTTEIYIFSAEVFSESKEK